MTPVRVYWSNGCFAFLRRRHDAEGLVRIGRGVWTPLAQVPGPEACADAGAARFLGADDELVVLLHDSPPDVATRARSALGNLRRNLQRDRLAVAAAGEQLRAANDCMALLVRTGRPLDHRRWRSATACNWRDIRRRTELRGLAAAAARGPRPVLHPVALRLAAHRASDLLPTTGD